MANGEVHGDAATERVPENERRRDRKTSHDARNVVGELQDIRVGSFQRRSEREAGQIDDMHRPAEVPKRSDLRSEPAPVGGDPRKNDRVRWCAATPGRDAEAVSLARGY